MTDVNKEVGEVIAVNHERVKVEIRASKNCEKCSLCSRISSSEMVKDAESENERADGLKRM